ncbi:MAG: hypothetical protein JW726_11735 [Anaerolineales bacterium]|nr:hypothetical protein [Anaerolineales bacterium]
MGQRGESVVIPGMVAASTVHFGLQIVGGPRSQSVGKTPRDKHCIKVRIGIVFLPQTQAAPVMAARAVDLSVVGMLFCSRPSGCIVAIDTLDVITMRIMTVDAVPALVGAVDIHFLDDLKAVLSLMAVSAQLVDFLYWLVST